jgi:heavy metal sensor kinase
MALPIRIRLTLWYALAIAVTLFLIGFAALWMVHCAIDDLEHNELQQRVRSVRRFIESRPATEPTDQLRREMTSLFKTMHGGKWLQVINERGEWLYRAPHVAAKFPTLELPQNLPADGRYFTYSTEWIPVSGYSAPITIRGLRYTVQTGLTLSKTIGVLSNFRLHLFLLIAFGLIFSTIAGHLMSRKALSPVVALTAEAQKINARNLRERLPAPKANDELSELAGTLNQMLERIDQAFASIRTFTGNASHELRTPISLMRTEIEVALIRPRRNEEYRSTLDRLHEETVRMTELVENLLSLVRDDSGAESFPLAPISLRSLFEEAGRTWRNTMDRAMLSLIVEEPPEGICILGNDPALTRLLAILLENASKYTPPGGVVTLRTQLEEGRAIIIVSDTGIGIPIEFQNKIFDRFFRAPSSQPNAPSGSGLGLALAKRLAERHATSLFVESEPGNGSCFSFSLTLSIPHSLLRNRVELILGER